MFPARGLNRDRCIPLCTTFSGWALGNELRRLNGLRRTNVVVYLPQSGDRLRDDLHSKSLFLVKNKGQWNAKSSPKAAYGNFANANEIFGTFGFEMRASGQKLVTFCTLTHIHTHTHTTAAKLVVRMTHCYRIQIVEKKTWRFGYGFEFRHASKTINYGWIIASKGMDRAEWAWYMEVGPGRGAGDNVPTCHHSGIQDITTFSKI